jgi:uncharacterized SAM-binding protein YcdF (DUF218 family)
MSGARPSFGRLAGLAAALLGVTLAGAWLGGLAWFTRAIPQSVADTDTVTDAIVVLTGGSLRVPRGLALLADGKAKKLFISGVYQGVDVAELLHLSRQSPDRVACCIVLGHAADNTRGNALETEAFMREEDFHSLRLVTASYHMPRSLLEFHRAMPNVAIIVNPVFPQTVKRRWWAWPGTFSLIVNEYDKYLVALVRPLVLSDAVSGEKP